MDSSFFPLLVAANRYRILDYDLPAVFGMPAAPLIVLGLIIASIVIGMMVAKSLRLRDYGWKLGLILSTVSVATFVVLFGDFKLGVDLKGGVILVYEVNELESKQLQGDRDEAQFNMSQLTAVITKRLNPTGLKEIVVRPFGPKQVEIVVPEVDPKEIEIIKEQIRTGGVLQFMIVATEDKDSELFGIARDQATKDGDLRLQRFVVDADNRPIGYWATLGREKDGVTFRALETLDNALLRDGTTGQILDVAREQKRLYAQSSTMLQRFLDERNVKRLDVLMAYDPIFDIRGEDLASARPGHDEAFRPAIHFNMTSQSSIKMGHVTSENLQRKLAIIFDNELLSAPVIQSKISDQGQITGNFTQEEVDFIVGILKSGSMPVVMQKEPISENQIGAILGMDTIIKGSWSIGISLASILVFTAIYYRFAGLVACAALVMNLLLTLAIMILIQAPLTLPGLAGLVLTVGMSVDSNVLIFERMREELARGAALRMAIRNGFDRAMVTIVDSNLTTLLTAVVLYFIGTDQVKGFGITLILGILTSMFTAIFVARVIFDIGERTRWLKTLTMMQMIPPPRVDWVRLFGPAAVASVLVIGLGLAATVARGKGLFDIDLAGGTSVTFILREPMPVTEVRAKLDKVLPEVIDPENKTKAQYTAYELSLAGGIERPQTVYKVDSSLLNIDLLKSKVREAFRGTDGSDLLKTYRIEVGAVEEAAAESPAAPASISAPGSTSTSTPTPTSTSTPAQGTGGTGQKSGAGTNAEKGASTGDKGAGEKGTVDKGAAEKNAAEKSAQEKAAEENQPAIPGGKKDEAAPPATDNSSGCGEVETAQEPGADTATEQGKTAEPAAPEPKNEPNAEPQAKTANDAAKADSATASPPATTPPATSAPATTPASAAEPATTPSIEAAVSAPARVKSVATLKFPGSPISAASLQTRIKEAAKSVINRELAESDILVENTAWDRQDNSAFEDWKVTLPLSRDQAQAVLAKLQNSVAGDVVWQTSSQIGGQVSADARRKAFAAIVFSLLGIVAYMWFRFQKAVWGIAAVVALAHDSLVMLGGIAVSYWLADALGFAGVEQFKISLPVIAAFLTLIGFSVNDTIVIFDRVREIRGKSPNLTRQMLNDAVNLTMSRTILTSGTVFVVVTVLYFFGGPGIHAFAFSLVIGVLSGTYSTVFIAAPLLLWMFNREQASSGSPAAAASKFESRDARRSIA